MAKLKRVRFVPLLDGRSLCALAAVGFVCGAISPQSVGAQAIEEIVVSARKMEQGIQDTATSVTALTEGQIERRGMDDWRDWADFVPSLHISSPPNGDRNGINPVIRGIVNTNHSSGNATMGSATSSLLIGDVPIFGVDPRLPDMNRIEVLKGPQGTLYGAAAMGGIIKFVPNYADATRFHGKIIAGSGFVNDGGQDYDFSVMANLPIVEDILAIRGVAYYRREAGFVDLRIRGLSEIGTVETTPQRALVEGATPFFDIRECKVTAPQTGNTAACIKDVNVTDVTGMRLTATYTPNESFEVRPMFMHQLRQLGHNNNVDGNDPLNRYAERFMTLPSSESFWMAGLEASYDFGAAELVYVGSYLERDYGAISDFTYGIFGDKNRRPLIPDTPPMTVIPAPMPLNFENDSETTTQELRLQLINHDLGGVFGSNMTADIIAGYFYARDKRETLLDSKNPEWNLRADPAYQMLADGCFTCGDTTVWYTNSAFFADVTLNLTDRLSIGVGARHFDQKLEQFSIGFGDSGNRLLPVVSLDTTGKNPGGPATFAPVKESDVTARAGISYKVTDDHLVFYNYGQGFRLGLFQNPTSLDTATQVCRELAESLGVAGSQIDSDQVDSHEFGLKSSWLDSRLVVNPTIFYSKWSDLQQSVILTSINSTCPQVLNGNIGEAENKGVDLEVVFQMSDGISFNGALSYIDAEISDAPPGTSGQVGDKIAGVPEWTGSLGSEYSFPLPMRADLQGYFRIDWRYVASRQLNFGAAEAQNPLTVSDSYNIGNVRFGVQSDSWEAALYVDNVTDTEVSFSSRIVTGVAWAEDRSTNRPLTVGVTVSKLF